MERTACLWVDLSTQKEEVFHNYIKGICQRLLGDTLDLDKQNIIFVLSDNVDANVEYYHENNVDVIAITPALLGLCENEDQLAFILGQAVFMTL